ncbi:MAG TPA: hypothetical protein VG961_11275, partial [Ignavibacteria bacterium]|nr:hypothetical protein [Ignavibacteria bacterium]
MKYIFLLALFTPFLLFAQTQPDPYNESLNDSLQKIFEENALKIDTLNLKVSSIIVTGNKT